MKKNSLYALAAAGLLAGFGAQGAMAADLGGDCCADLEERVAELEATTARKGNRKVSLTLSGFVAQQVLAWDDGEESNVYVTDTGSVSIGTHFAFSGQAQITPDTSAGFMIKIEAINNDSLGVNQDTDEGGNVFAAVQGGSGPLALESAYWYLKSNTLGRLSIGQQSSAADNQAILPDGSGSLVQANYVLYDVQGFVTRSGGAYNTGVDGTFSWGAIANCHPVGVAVAADCDGYPSNVVRYDTPTFAGFSASASWGEDDVWAVSGRYAGEMAGFKLAAAVAYVQNTDEGSPGATNANAGALANGGLDAAHLQTGAYLEHVQTGLFVYGAYGVEDNEVTASSRGAGRLNPDGENWYIKAGIKGKWNSLGGTTIYGEYGNNDDKMSNGLFDAGVSASELEQYGVGIVQNIDAAAMQMWISWRHYEGDVTCDSNLDGVTGAGCAGFGLAEGNNDLEEFDLVKFGALIAF
ncbi:MAG: porin [Alphaproteobacteria bacterium]|nr:porin [Alphaproteobacteria bacterium]